MALQRTIGTQIFLSNNGGLKCVESNPIIEDSFEEQSINTDFWESFTRDSGYINFKNGVVGLNSGKINGSVAKITSKKTAHSISGQCLIFESSLNMNAASLDNPSIRWGMYNQDNSNAIYFDFNSSSYLKILYPLIIIDTNHVKLDDTFSDIDGFYQDYYSLYVVDKNNRYEIRKITNYIGSTRVATLNYDLGDYLSSEISCFLVNHVLNATSNSITMAPNSINIQDFYKGDLIYILDGKGKGQLRGIVSYDSINKILVTGNWDIIPDTSSRFIISSKPISADSNTVILKNGFSEIDDYYNEMEVMIIHGSGSGQRRTVKDYIGSEQKITIYNIWESIPNAKTFQCVLRTDGIEHTVTSNNFCTKDWSPPSYNTIYRIFYSSEVVDFYVSADGYMIKLATFSKEQLNFASVSEYSMFFAVSNIGGDKNNFMQIRGCNISNFGSLRLFRPMSDKVDVRSLSTLTTSVLLGKTEDDQFKNIKVDDQGRVILAPHLELDVSSEVKYILGKTKDEDIWQGRNFYLFPDVPSWVYIKSSDPKDKVGSSGARVLKIEGLDSDFNSIEEQISLNGKTEVTGVANFLRINNIDVIEAGTDGQNVGTIDIQMNYSSGSKILIGKINPGDNTIFNSNFTIPNQKKGFIHQIYYKGKKEATVNLRVRKQGGVFITKYVGDQQSFVKPIEIDQKSDIKMSVPGNKDELSGGYTLEIV